MDDKRPSMIAVKREGEKAQEMLCAATIFCCTTTTVCSTALSVHRHSFERVEHEGRQHIHACVQFREAVLM